MGETTAGLTPIPPAQRAIARIRALLTEELSIGNNLAEKIFDRCAFTIYQAVSATLGAGSPSGLHVVKTSVVPHLQERDAWPTIVVRFSDESELTMSEQQYNALRFHHPTPQGESTL